MGRAWLYSLRKLSINTLAYSSLVKTWSQHTQFGFPSAGVTCNEGLSSWVTLRGDLAIWLGKGHKPLFCHV
jgi:hypothetical protein